MLGRVKFFSKEKGFGFIFSDENDNEYFIHKNLLEKYGIDNLHKGEQVEFEGQQSPKGLEVTEIRIKE